MDMAVVTGKATRFSKFVTLMAHNIHVLFIGLYIEPRDREVDSIISPCRSLSTTLFVISFKFSTLLVGGTSECHTS